MTYYSRIRLCLQAFTCVMTRQHSVVVQWQQQQRALEPHHGDAAQVPQVMRDMNSFSEPACWCCGSGSLTFCRGCQGPKWLGWKHWIVVLLL